MDCRDDSHRHLHREPLVVAAEPLPPACNLARNLLLYKVYMKKIQIFNDEANKLFKDEVMMPMVTFAVTLMVFAVLIDFTFQLIDVIETLTTL